MLTGPPGTPSAPVRAAASVAVPMILLLGAGCGGSAGTGDSPAARSTPSKAPDAATTACRTQWKQLRGAVAAQDGATTPSALPGRWDNVVATLDHYVAAATARDCGSTLAGQKKSIAQLQAFNRRLVAYDLPRRLTSLEDPGATYAARAKAATRRTGTGKKAKVRTGPAPKQVKAALATLTRQAPLATRQQGPAWQQATATDPGDRAAVAKAVKDLKFLSGRSGAYRAGKAAADTVQRAASFLG